MLPHVVHSQPGTGAPVAAAVITVADGKSTSRPTVAMRQAHVIKPKKLIEGISELFLYIQWLWLTA